VGRFVDILKLAFVEVIEEDFRVPGRKLSISRIALLSGLTRREASRLVDSTWLSDLESPRRQLNRAASVFEAWSADPRFQDAEGRPAALPFDDEEGAEASFKALVRAHGADVPARAILDELVRVGAVGATRDGRVRPLQNTYVSLLEDDAKLAIHSADVADLISTISHNLSSEPGDRFLQESMSYDRLPAGSLSSLRDQVFADGRLFLDRLSSEMSQLEARDSRGSEAEFDLRRAKVGVFYFEEESSDPS
jgi:hypothetical protein